MKPALVLFMFAPWIATVLACIVDGSQLGMLSGALVTLMLFPGCVALTALVAYRHGQWSKE